MSEPNPQLAVGAVCVVDGSLLLIQRATAPGAGLWSLPGGRVEVGETLRDALVREVAEETGLAVTAGDLVGWVERIDADHHFVIFDFVVVPVGDREVVAGDDAAAAAWVPLAELGARPLVPGLAAFLRDHGVVTGQY